MARNNQCVQTRCVGTISLAARKQNGSSLPDQDVGPAVFASHVIFARDTHFCRPHGGDQRVGQTFLSAERALLYASATVDMSASVGV